MKIVILLISFFIIQKLHSQIPVSKEPRHHVVFENKKLRVLNVLIKPGDTTLFHIHSTPSLFVCFTKTKTAEQRKGKEFTSGNSTPGQMWFENLAYPHIKTHRVANIDQSTYHVMDIELLSADSGFSQPPVTFENSKLIFDTSWGRAYHIDLPIHHIFYIPSSTSTFILIGLLPSTLIESNGSINKVHQLHEGNIIYLKPKQKIKIENSGTQKSEIALFEIK